MSIDSAKELETWYKEWCDAKLHAVQTKRDCTPRDALGVDFDAFSEMVAKLAPIWSSDNAAELLKRLFDFLDSNNDNVKWIRAKSVILIFHTASRL